MRRLRESGGGRECGEREMERMGKWKRVIGRG